MVVVVLELDGAVSEGVLVSVWVSVCVELGGGAGGSTTTVGGADLS